MLNLCAGRAAAAECAHQGSNVNDGAEQGAWSAITLYGSLPGEAEALKGCRVSVRAFPAFLTGLQLCGTHGSFGENSFA